MHGGDLDAAQRLFPGAPEPWLDLSTGINPHPYLIPAISPEEFARLPAKDSLARLVGLAADVYGAPSGTNVVPAPGSQILMTLLARSVPPGRAAILGPTYAEHARVSALAGHAVTTVSELEALGDADLATVVNPNNPDGRVFAPDALLGVAERLSARGGLLIVDEAFIDASAEAESLSARVEDANVVVLRSFGKFFGLAGIRLSFALAAKNRAAQLQAELGPWPVSGPALATGIAALSDSKWMEATRALLAVAAQRLDAMLAGAGLERVGGTELFTLIRSPDAKEIFDRLGRAGLFVRYFDEHPDWLRFGLPGTEDDWRRLEAALRD